MEVVKIMFTDPVEATSSQLWLSALVFLLIALIGVWILSRRVDRDRFRKLRWYLVAAAVLFWSAFAILLVQAFWDSYYQYFYPEWIRGGGILVYVPLIYGLSALAFHWLALRLPGNPILIFFLLCGIESILEHLWGIVGMDILNIPMFEEASVFDILVIAVPEYIFYWCLVIVLALFLARVGHWLRKITT